MEERGWPVLVAAVAVVAGVLLVLPGDDDGGGRGPVDPVAELLAAYERSLTGTFVAEQRFTRTAPDGRSISYDQRLVQRPPGDRLLVGGGNGEGRLDGRIVRCFTSVDGSSRCDESVDAEPYEAFVAAELGRMRRLVAGANPAYEVRPGQPGCWSLHLRLDVHPPPFGTVAGFCFDAETGAVLRQEERRPEATDVIEAVEVRSEVTAADLRPGDLGDLPEPTDEPRPKRATASGASGGGGTWNFRDALPHRVRPKPAAMRFRRECELPVPDLLSTARGRTARSRRGNGASGVGLERFPEKFRCRLPSPPWSSATTPAPPSSWARTSSRTSSSPSAVPCSSATCWRS